MFVQSWLSSNDASIIEVGCGNGRDSRFFHQMGHTVTVSDQVICDDLQRFAMARHNFAAVETSIVDAVDSLRHAVDFLEHIFVLTSLQKRNNIIGKNMTLFPKKIIINEKKKTYHFFMKDLSMLMMRS